MTTRHIVLLSEIKELENILAQIPTSNVIERLSFESRLVSALENVDQLPALVSGERARLTFRGRPVVGSQGVAAEFGSKAIGTFVDAFAAVIAGLNESLRYMGPIPDKAKNQLLITGTAVGSFGFELELPAPDLFRDPGKGGEALKKIQDLFKISADGSDDEVAELVELIHPRAVKKVWEFLSYLVQQQSWCGLEFDDRFFRFSDIDQLKKSADRLQESNIHESQDIYTGELQGVLPNSRTFEFKFIDQDGIIKGKVDKAIDDPDILNRNWLHKPISIRLDVVQVGQGRPRYALRNLVDIQPLVG